ELRNSGQIDRLPRLFAAQPLHCSPLDASFQAGVDSPVERAVLPTIAEGTSIAAPLRLREMLEAVRTSGGGTVAVTEAEIGTALAALCAQGLFVEPTSAVGGAALTHLLDTGVVAPEEDTVVILTGSGLKAAN